MAKFKQITLPLAAIVALSSIQPAYAADNHGLTPNSGDQDSHAISKGDSIQIGDEVFTQQDRKEFRNTLVEAGQDQSNNATGSESSTYGVGSLVRKTVTYILKKQKHRLPKKVVPWADKIIAALDYAEAWEVGSLSSALVSQGVPPDVAYDFAYWAVFIVSPA